MAKHKYKRTRLRAKKKFPTGLILFGGIVMLIITGVVSLFRGGSAQQEKSDESISGSPRLVVDQEIADLGDIKLGRTVNISFKLANVGDAPLKIIQNPFVEVKEGC